MSTKSRTTVNEPATEAGRELAAKAKREAWSNWEWLVRQTIPAIEREAAERASGGLDADEWADVMLNALCRSDNGNNPFYSDDADTVSLARELAETVVTRLATPQPGEPSRDE